MAPIFVHDTAVEPVPSILRKGPVAFYAASQQITPPLTPPIRSCGDEDVKINGLNIAGADSVKPEEEVFVAVIGCGYVGTHLIAAFSEKYRVLGFDVDEKRLEVLRKEHDPRVMFTIDPHNLTQATHILVSVPTLVQADRTIDTKYIRSALDTISTFARPGTTVVIESSVAVGMTRDLLGPLASRMGFFAGMSPERVDPGRADPPLTKIPKILSGLDDIIPGSLEVITRLYSEVFETIIPVSSPEVAEMTKLYENCQRMMGIAFANEMADACITHEIDPYEVSKAAASKPFGYMPFEPGLGLGGHCIPVNPYYLFCNSEFPLLKAATQKMEQRPEMIAERVLESLFYPEHEDYFSMTKSSEVRLRYTQGNFVEHKETPQVTTIRSIDPSATKDVGRIQVAPEYETAAAAPAVDLKFGASQITVVTRPQVLIVGVGFKPGQSHLVNSPGLRVAQALLKSDRVDIMYADALVEQSAVPSIPRFDLDRWSKGELEAFDSIIVSFKQRGLDMSVLDELEGVRVERWYQTW
jgi:nucleotide sugar dehydrogenase